MGPHSPNGPRTRRQGSSRNRKDSLAHTIEAARRTKRWLFPLLAILATIVAVILILDWQAAPLEHVTPLNP